MLEEHYRGEWHRFVTELPCRVAPPGNCRDTYFSESGVVDTVLHDRRRFVRHKYRTKAVLEVEPTLPAFPRTGDKSIVLVRDVSRQGVGFLHIEQLFPQERCRLWLPTKCSPLQVTNCRRLDENCYLIGARFVDPRSDDDEWNQKPGFPGAEYDR